MSSFKGFKEGQVTNPRESLEQAESSSNSEASDFDTAADSAETTPNKNYSNPNTNTVQKKKSDKASVRQLIEYFSSDSDTTSEKTRQTRRRKSLTAEHIQLPPGGEKEIRRRMAEQNKADQLVGVYQALSGEFATSMNETDQILGTNPSRDVKIGHLVGLTAEFEDLEKEWKKIEEFNERSVIDIGYINLMLARNKIKTRYHRLKGLITANTEKETPAPTSFKISNSTSFGNLKLPEFNGDYVEFDNFEALFRNLINNGNLDEGGKLAHLLNNLKGEAREFIGHDGLAEKTYEQVWKELKSRYGKPWRITRAAVKKTMDIKDPSDDPSDISRYWNQINEACKVAERLKLSATSIILNMALLKLPTEFRSKMDDKLKVVSDKYILTREQVAEPFNDIIAGESEKPGNVIATLGYNTATAANSINQNTRGTQQQPNKHGLSKGKPRTYCFLCSNRGHKTPECLIYTSGPRIQSRLREMGRCIRCTVPFKEHGQECSHRVSCRDHPGERHIYFACNDFRNIHQIEARPPMLQPRPTQALGNKRQHSGQQNA